MFNFIFAKKFKDDYVEYIKTVEKRPTHTEINVTSSFVTMMQKSELDIKTSMNMIILKNNFECMDKVNMLYKNLFQRNAQFNIFLGTETITLIIENSHVEVALSTLGEYIIQHVPNVIKMHIKGTEEIQNTPGLVYNVVGGFAEHGINILAVLGSYNELILMINSSDFDKLANLLKEINN